MNPFITMIIGAILNITGVALTIWLFDNDYIILFPIGSIGMAMLGVFMMFYVGENDV